MPHQLITPFTILAVVDTDVVTIANYAFLGKPLAAVRTGTARLVVTLRSLKWRARGRLRCPRNYTMDSLNENDNLWQRPGMKQHVHIRCRSILVLFR